MTPAAALEVGDIIESGGIWYKYTTYSRPLYIVKSPEWTADQEYSGALELPSKVEYDGSIYEVFALNSTTLNKSLVTEFTVGEGFEPTTAKDQGFNIWLRQDPVLERINLKSFAQADESGEVPMLISAGNSEKCVHVCYRDYGDHTEVAIENFNVYGPDGKKLKPFLTSVQNVNTRVYPDENGVIKLGPNFSHDTTSRLVILTSSYAVAFFGVEYQGRFCIIRTEPAIGQTGISVTQNGLRYAITGSEAYVTTPESGTYAGVPQIPATVNYEGKDLPVTRILPGAFENSDISSISVPANIKTVGDNAFRNCHSLESADLSAITDAGFLLHGYDMFAQCTSLKDVTLPPAVKRIHTRMFLDCSSLSSITLPASVTAIGVSAFENSGLESIILPENLQTIALYAFAGCQALTSMQMPNTTVILSGPFNGETGLVTYDILENTSERVRFTCDMELYDTAGRKISLTAFNTAKFVGQETRPGYYTPENDVFTINKSSMTAPNGIYNGRVSIYFSPDMGEILPPNDLSGTCYSFMDLEIPQESTGIDSPAADNSGAPVEIYDLSGRRCHGQQLAPGIYIRRQGTATTKFMVR